MKFIIILLLLIIIASCDPPYNEYIPYLPNKQSQANEVRNQAFVQLQRDKELYPFGIGSQMMNQIEMLGLYFQYYKEINIDEARELLMTAATVFLDVINKNEHIRPFLSCFPFKPNNIEIQIYLTNLDGSQMPPEKLCVATMTNGVLEYMANQAGTHRSLTIYTETFDQADSKLKALENIKLCAVRQGF